RPVSICRHWGGVERPPNSPPRYAPRRSRGAPRVADGPAAPPEAPPPPPRPPGVLPKPPPAPPWPARPPGHRRQVPGGAQVAEAVRDLDDLLDTGGADRLGRERRELGDALVARRGVRGVAADDGRLAREHLPVLERHRDARGRPIGLAHRHVGVAADVDALR